MFRDLDKVLISPDAPILEAIRRIDQGGVGIVLVVDSNARLLGTITDGDIRRAVLLSVDLTSPVFRLLEKKKPGIYSGSITARPDASREELLRLMQENVVKQIPIIDQRGKILDLVTLDILLPNRERDVEALIMAGGYGTRLRPLTAETPKPMLPLGDHSVLEFIIDQLKKHGIHRITVSIHFMSDKIRDYFGDGGRFGVKLRYIEEEEQLGTAGAIALLPNLAQPLLVINGDIVTNLDFGALIDFHTKNKAQMSVAVRHYSFQVPYGVLDCIDYNVVGIREKPVHNFFVNAGIYVIAPECQSMIPVKSRFDMTDLIGSLLQKDQRVLSFPVVEYWLDIGEHSDYQKARIDYSSGRIKK